MEASEDVHGMAVNVPKKEEQGSKKE